MTARRLRVLHVIARMNVGGPAQHVATLLDGLRDQHEVRLLSGFVQAGEEDYLALHRSDLPVTMIPGLGRSVRFGGDVRALRRLTAEIRDFRPDIVHTHTAKAGALGRVAARRNRVPVTVHSYHGHLLHGYFPPPVTAAVVAVERVLARSTTRLVAVGGQVRDDLLAARIGRPGQYVVQHPGVPAPAGLDDPKAARRALGLPEDALVVAFVGRLTQIKRPDRFVEVAEELARRRPEAAFVVVGEGGLLEAVRRQAAGLGERFRTVGFRPDVATAYRACDVLLLTSDNEGMPLTLVEAALCERPAVTTAVGSAPEVVSDGLTGFVVPADVPALVDAVDRLLGDADLRRRFGQAAAERARERFGTERLLRETTDLYESLSPLRGART